MKLLRDFLLVNTPDTVDGTPRRTSAWLLLDLVRRGVRVDDEAAIRRAFYHRQLQGNKIYKQSGEIIDRWRVYQANELCHVALEVWLNAVALKVDTYTSGGAPSVVINDLLGVAFKTEELRGSWKAWATAVGNVSVAEEEALTESVLLALRDLNVAQESTALQGAIKVLAILWMRWGNGAGTVRERLQHHAGVRGRSLAQVLTSFDLRAEREARRVVAEVLQEHVVEGHLNVAARKLAASDKFTYRFFLSDGVLSDGTSTNYGFTNPRLRNLGRFLRDAKLCMDDALSMAGERFLDDYKPA
jgi:hypothetical protein